MGVISVSRDAAVEAPLVYIEPPRAKPFVYNYEPPAGEPRRSAVPLPQAVRITDGRPRADRFSLDIEGFAFRRDETSITDFYDEAEVERRYYPAMERLLTEATGADKVVIFDHTLRNGGAFPKVREPVRAVHNDYTVRSGPQRVRDLLPPEEAAARLRHRFAIINVWRPVRGPVASVPLALCDARSIAPHELIATDLRYPDRTGEIYSVTHNPRHRWYYFPRMTRDEVVLIKCYDSATDGRARFAAHTGFDDPSTPADAAPRESIEIRALVFFPPAEA
ncbi:methyltransferase [Oleomonas cavernae]|uniref:Methyltransferase n=1 Tax=Oleomonas cavernae TaxID=2320859 RepID=A0A418W8J4_9PROT|nr:CmcJ/NvfI family oxidoreductase [Oleomonas cavernae]RJF86330.1 methyltransferase [Oleomonas cavernae]